MHCSSSGVSPSTFDGCTLLDISVEQSQKSRCSWNSVYAPVKYSRTCFVVSVLPAPLSPDTMMLWSCGEAVVGTAGQYLHGKDMPSTRARGSDTRCQRSRTCAAAGRLSLFHGSYGGEVTPLNTQPQAIRACRPCFQLRRGDAPLDDFWSI